ncbi:MAG: hypothetical protein ABIC68_00305 [Candidatus Omnitrophota bacterium]
MRTKQLKIIGLVFLLSCFFSGCSQTQDVQFARSIMTLLAKGVYSVTKMIDWPSLRMLERDIGGEYQRLLNDQEKEYYEKAFVEGFRLAFADRGGSLKSFKDWHFYGSVEPDLSVVSANTPDKKFALLFVIKHENGSRKLVEIKLMQVTDPELFFGKK